MRVAGVDGRAARGRPAWPSSTSPQSALRGGAGEAARMGVWHPAGHPTQPSPARPPHQQPHRRAIAMVWASTASTNSLGAPPPTSCAGSAACSRRPPNMPWRARCARSTRSMCARAMAAWRRTAACGGPVRLGRRQRSRHGPGDAGRGRRRQGGGARHCRPAPRSAALWLTRRVQVVDSAQRLLGGRHRRSAGEQEQAAHAGSGCAASGRCRGQRAGPPPRSCLCCTGAPTPGHGRTPATLALTTSGGGSSSGGSSSSAAAAAAAHRGGAPSRISYTHSRPPPPPAASQRPQGDRHME